jgi:hypothetical protein
MSNHIERINLSNATHNGGAVPDGWILLPDENRGYKEFGPITTQAYQNTITNEVVLTIKGTDGDIADWTVVNASFATGNYPKEIKDLVAYSNLLNIEKIAVSTSVATIADFVTYKGTDGTRVSKNPIKSLR